MALPSSGALSLSMVNTELNRSASAAISMNDADVRALFGKPSGVISLSDGYGKANALVVLNVTPGLYTWSGSNSAYQERRGVDNYGEDDYLTISGGSLSPNSYLGSVFNVAFIDKRRYGPEAFAYSFYLVVTNAHNTSGWLEPRSVELNGVKFEGRFMRNYDVKNGTILNTATFRPFATTNDEGRANLWYPTAEQQTTLNALHDASVRPLFDRPATEPFTFTLR